jgi:hypothetical protein
MAPYEPPVAHYAHVDVSDYDESMILCMVGKGGEGFYKITDWLKLDYVWFDSENKRIELWGPFKSFENGCRQKLENSLKDFSSRFTIKNNAC